ncbi:MAG TPA: cellulase family glycosylhydrolase [Candidatus Sulfopaludibacter sp.]|nr:cellulase family glycosylhydrolase [Candidatus Sulfopaludibacter sp.]
MRTRTIVLFVSGLLLASVALQFAATGHPNHPGQQVISTAASGPYRVQANRLLDVHGRVFLMRGTQLPAFHLSTAAWNNRAADDYGAHSATSLSAIRLRFNMNAVRLPLDVSDAASPEYLAELARVVRRINEMEMVAVLSAREPNAGLPTAATAEFWSRCAAYFKSYPNVVFDGFADPDPAAVADAHSPAGWQAWTAAMQTVIHAIRQTGATQPVIAASWKDARLFEGLPALLDDANVVYGVTGEYADTRTDADRDAHFGFLAARAPVLASGWDLHLNDAVACAALPQDPSATSAIVESNLNYLDTHQISWMVSEFEPGKLIKDLSDHDATSLENGWTCGPGVRHNAGLGRVVQGHQRASRERGLFVVSGAGGMDLGRGGFALAYGPIMAERDEEARSPQPPAKLGGISVRITDSAGVARPAGMLWASAGWGQTNFVIPKNSALGPALMTIVRDDGSQASTNITIVETAPGFITGYSCRGAVKGFATQAFAGGRTVSSPISTCDNGPCRTVVIPMSEDAVTQVRLRASGIRNALPGAKLEIHVAGVRVPVISYGAEGEQGQDQVTIELPQSLRGVGETDLVCHLNGRVSNSVRVRIGGDKPTT